MKYFALAAVFAAILPLTAVVAQPVVVTLDQPETAGICGYRLMWDQPVMTGADGLRVVIEPEDKEYAILDRGGVAPWATPTLEAAGKPAALAFDAIHRTLLVRFPDVAEKIAAQINQGYQVEKLELVLPFEDEELWPEGGGFNPPVPPPGYGYNYRANWGVEWGYRVVRPRWHAVAWALKKPWTADAKLGPTYNAYINGAGYWAQFGAQTGGTDRLPTRFGPAEVSYQQPQGRLDLTSLLADEAYGATLVERLRTLADCGLALKKWETYDHLYYGGPYEWGTGVGGRAIIVQPPSLVATFAKADGAPRVGTLPPAADIPALAEVLKKTRAGGQPTAVMPTAAEIAALAKRFGPQRPDWMSDWQWQRVQELLAAAGNGHPDDPFWVPFLNPMLVKNLRVEPAADEAVGPIDWVRSYEMWVDLYLQRPYRGFHGHGTLSDLLVPWFEYREAMPAPVREWFINQFTAFLMPDRPTANHANWRRDYVDGPLVHPMQDFTALGAPADQHPSISERRFDHYVAKTGDWRGNKSMYRSGFNWVMSTQNFNNNSSLGALVGGGIIGSEYAMIDGRNGQAEWATRQWSWFDGSTQEELDDYYFAFTMKASKLVADYGPAFFDRLLGRSQLAKTTLVLGETYHSGLRRYVNGSSRTSLNCRLGTQEGLYAILHTLSKAGAVTDLHGDSTIPEGEAQWGHDTPPGEIARQALVSPYAPNWFQQVVDDKPLPFETTAISTPITYVPYPNLRRSYLGENFGLYSLNAQGGFLPITAHWRRQAKTPETSREIGTLLARFGVNQTWFPNHSPGWIRHFGMQAVLQSGPRMIIASSPRKLDAGYRIKSIQSSIGFFNYEEPAPTWQIYVGGKRIEALPATAKAGQWITIRDGVSYIGIIPLASTDLGRTDEVILRVGETQPYLDGQHRATAALVIDNVMLQRDAELPHEGTDWEAIDKGYSGFVIEFGDVRSDRSFEVFQKRLRDATLTTTFDSAQSLHEIHYQTGAEVLEMGVYTTYHPGEGSVTGIAPLDQLFAYQRVNGEDHRLPEGVFRDSPLSQQANTGLIEKGGATLNTTSGRMTLLQVEPKSKTVSAWNPLPDLNAFALSTADGVEIAADGKIGLACVTLEPATKTFTVDHAFNGEQADDPTAATALLAFGLKRGTRVVVNGERLAKPATVELDGRRALVIPLVANPPAATELVKRYHAAQATRETD